jgi:hypothetical protein
MDFHMKKLLIIALLLCSTNIFANELVHMTLENRQKVGTDYLIDVYAEPNGSWVVGPCTIVIDYNNLGLGIGSYGGMSVSNLDADLASGGYTCTQGNYGTGQISVDLFILSPNKTKTSKFKMCTIKLAITDGTKNDDLGFNTSESEILNNLSLLQADCNTSNCWDYTNPTSQVIAGVSISAPNLVTPQNNATNVDAASISFDWNDVAGATGYEIKVATDNAFTNIISYAPTTSSEYIPTAPFSGNTTYYWKVKANDGTNYSAWSAIWSFTTAATSANNELVHMTLENRQKVGNDYLIDVYAEPNGSWVVGPCTIVIDYNNLGLGIGSYGGMSVSNLDADLASGGYTCTQGNYGTGQISVDLFILSPNKTKTSKFKMCTIKLAITDGTKNDDLEFNISESEILNNLSLLQAGCNTSNCWDYTNPTSQMIGGVTISAPNLVSPQNNTTNVDAASISFDWNDVGGATGYEIKVATDNAFTNIISYAPTTSSEYTPTAPFSGNTTYYWKVKANDGTNYSAWSTVWSFTTAPYLEAPVLKAPYSNSTNITLPPTIEWYSVTGATNYNYKLSTTSSFSTIAASGTVSTTQASVSNLNPNTTYFWKVQATDGSTASVWSSIWTFTTATAATIGTPTLVAPMDGAIDVVIDPVLDWTDVTGAEEYIYEISESSSMAPVLRTGTIDVSAVAIASEVHIIGLDNDKTYYWRVKAADANITSNWTSVWSFTTEVASNLIDVPASWEYTDSTGSTMNSFILYNTTDMNLCDTPILEGDVIGVFFKDNGVEKCAGYAVWENKNFSLIINGDNPQTQVKDGMGNFEDLIYKIWDAHNGLEYYADINFQQGDDYYKGNTYNYIDQISAICDVTHEIPLGSGWNFISTFVEAENDSVADITKDISDNFLLMKSMAGQVYFPYLQIDALGTWNITDAYYLYMNAKDTLRITGMAVDYNTPIPLNTGWNSLAYLCDTEQDIEDALDNVSSNLLLVKNMVGHVYFPYLQITQLDKMKPGEGYLIYMNVKDTLIYPEPAGVIKGLANYTATVNRFENPTPFNQTLILETELTDGTEIVAYSEAGLLVGTGVVDNGIAVFAVYGDNEYTDEIDGLRNGEKIKFKAIYPDQSFEYAVKTDKISDLFSGAEYNELKFETNAVTTAKIASEMISDKEALSIMPNPAKSQTTLHLNLKSDSNISIELYDLDGKLITNLYSGTLIEKLNIDTSNLSAGTYAIIARDDNNVETIRFVVVK